jgi:hypothetical protein
MVPDDEYDLEAALVDGKDDYGVDYVFRSQNRVLVIQAKYHKHGTAEPIESFISATCFCGSIHEK